MNQSTGNSFVQGCGFGAGFAVGCCAVVMLIPVLILLQLSYPGQRVVPRTSSSNSTQMADEQAAQQSMSSSSPTEAQMPDPWVNAVGRIEAGVTVYWRNQLGESPSPWFTVINPYVQPEGTDRPYLLVQYAQTGRRDYIDRRAIIRSPAAMAGQLVIPRTQANY